jgi:hypothetical protein
MGKGFDVVAIWIISLEMGFLVKSGVISVTGVTDPPCIFCIFLVRGRSFLRDSRLSQGADGVLARHFSDVSSAEFGLGPTRGRGGRVR